jgi:integrase
VFHKLPVKLKKPPAPKRRARGTGSVFPDKRRGGWCARVPVGQYPNGRTKYREVRGDTQGEVVALMKNITAPLPGTTVAEWADHWLARATVRPTTHDDYAHTVERWIKPTLGHRRLAAVTAGDVENAVGSWELGPNTARKNLGQLRSMFASAVKAGILERNPARDARPPRAQKVVIQPFTPAELALIVRRATEHPRDHAFALLAATGMRIGEAFALDVGNYDRATGRVSITSTYTQSHGVRRAKSENSVRTVTVPAVARPAILRAIGKRSSGPLFLAPGTVRRTRPATARLHWRKFLTRLGIAYRSPHTLRHSVASHALASGVPLANVSRDLGDTIATIIKTYCHPTSGRDVSDAMGQILAGDASKSKRGGSR